MEQAAATQTETSTDPAWEHSGTFNRWSVLSKEELMLLSRPSTHRGVARWSVQVAALCCAIAATIGVGWSVWLVVAWPIQGALMASMFAPLHEATHQTAFASKRMNRVAAWFSGLFVMLQPVAYRHWHMEHHRHTQDQARDPELLGRPPRWPPLIVYLGIRVAAAMGLGLVYSLALLVSRALGKVEKLYPEQLHAALVREARGYCVAYGAIAASCWVFPAVTVAVVPWAVSQVLLLFWWSSEHTGCASDGSVVERTRTVVTNRVARFLMWNMPYHTAHHAFPSVPFFALPEVNRRLMPHLVHVSGSYVQLHIQVVSSLLRRRQLLRNQGE
jgi:fatty acid desaturase